MLTCVQNNNNINFTSTPLRSVNIKNIANEVETGLTRACFSHLDPGNPEDGNAMRKIIKNWQKNIENLLLPEDVEDRIKGITTRICEQFFEPKPDEEFFAIELPKETANIPLAERILGLFKLKVSEDNLSLPFIVTHPKLVTQYEKRRYKGVGEAMIGEIIRIAKKDGFLSVGITSSNDDFYIKTLKNAKIPTGKEVCDCSYFQIPRKYFDTYLNYIDKKYKNNTSSGLDLPA